VKIHELYQPFSLTDHIERYKDDKKQFVDRLPARKDIDDRPYLVARNEFTQRLVDRLQEIGFVD
jgi:hypothetical protein